VHVETESEWIALGTRIHGGFGPLIPIGIRIGLDAIIRNRKTGEGLRYAVSEQWMPKVGEWIRTLDPPGRFQAVMKADELFLVMPAPAQ